MSDSPDLENLMETLPSKLVGHVTSMPPAELAVVAFAASPAGIAQMVDRCRKGLPPVVALSDTLVRWLGPDVKHQNAVKQRMGRIVRFLLEDTEWRFAGSRPIRNDPVFASGAIYRRAPGSGSRSPEDGGSRGLLERFVGSLTDAELADLKFIITAVEKQRA